MQNMRWTHLCLRSQRLDPHGTWLAIARHAWRPRDGTDQRACRELGARGGQRLELKLRWGAKRVFDRVFAPAIRIRFGRQ